MERFFHNKFEWPIELIFNQRIMICSLCKCEGHNKRSCTMKSGASVDPIKQSVSQIQNQSNELYPDVDLRGMGGKENEILKLFPTFKRVDHALYDFVDENGRRYEVKKTQFKRLQSWIDPMKYIDISDDDRNIIFRFVHFDNSTGKCIEVVDTTLGEIIDRFIPKEMIEPTRKILEIFPNRGKLQFKLDIKWR